MEAGTSEIPRHYTVQKHKCKVIHLAGIDTTTNRKILQLPSPNKNDIDADIINLKVNASWLVCAEICIPGEATLDISLPVLNSGHIKKTSGVIKNLKKDFFTCICK